MSSQHSDRIRSIMHENVDEKKLFTCIVNKKT